MQIKDFAYCSVFPMAYVVIESTVYNASCCSYHDYGHFLWFICIWLLSNNYSLLSALLLPYAKDKLP